MRRSAAVAIGFVLLLAACGDAGSDAADDSIADLLDDRMDTTAIPLDSSPAVTTPTSSDPPDPAPPESPPVDSTPVGTTPPPEPAPPDDDRSGSAGPPTTLPERVPPPESPLPAGPVDTSAVPADLMDRILADAAERAGLGRRDLVPVRADAVVWNDGSLGCPRPGETYTQALVDGYWVILVGGERTLDYRASAGGYFFVCDTATPGPGTNPTG